MYLPKTYEDFSDKFPEIFKDYQQLGKSCREAGPLGEKYQDLIKLGIAVDGRQKKPKWSSNRLIAGSGRNLCHAI